MLRKPAVAGIFYPDNPEDLKNLLKMLLSKMGVGEIPILNDFDSSDYPINIMVPHAGYYYSGAVASHSYCEIVKIGFPEVLLF